MSANLRTKKEYDRESPYSSHLNFSFGNRSNKYLWEPLTQKSIHNESLKNNSEIFGLKVESTKNSKRKLADIKATPSNLALSQKM